MTIIPKSAKEEFIEFITQLNRSNGYDEPTSRIIAILYIEPEEIALEELAKRTGYSLSAISMAMKGLETFGLVKRLRKPGSRKAYFYMEKDLMGTVIEILSRKLVRLFEATKVTLPNIIEKYQKETTASAKAELGIVQDYYEEVLVYEKIIADLIQKMNGVRRKKER